MTNRGAVLVGCDDCTLKVWQTFGEPTAGSATQLHSATPVALVLPDGQHTGEANGTGSVCRVSLFL